jgi:heptosyltransferase-2
MSVPKRILIRGVNWLGDAIMSTPALQRLREALPEAEIVLLTPSKLAEVWRHYPNVNRVIEFSPQEGPWRVAGRLRHDGFDTALVLPNSPRSALDIWLARIPTRIGYSRPWRNWFLTRALPARLGHVRMKKRSAAEAKHLLANSPASARTEPPVTAHHLFDYLHLAAVLGAKEAAVSPRLCIAPDELEETARRFDLEGKQLLFGMNAGAQYGPAKRWPVERFIAAAAEVQKRSNCRWLIFGGAHETELASQIAEGINQAAGTGDQGSAPLNVAGRSSLRDLCVLLKACRVLLTNDSGPMHVAAAVGTPVVVPFGSTSPEMTGPGLPGSREGLLIGQAPCAPCFLRQCPVDFRCMNSISVPQVVDALINAAAPKS